MDRARTTDYKNGRTDRRTDRASIQVTPHVVAGAVACAVVGMTAAFALGRAGRADQVDSNPNQTHGHSDRRGDWLSASALMGSAAILGGATLGSAAILAGGMVEVGDRVATTVDRVAMTLDKDYVLEK